MLHICQPDQQAQALHGLSVDNSANSFSALNKVYTMLEHLG